MIFEESSLPGVYVVTPPRHGDDRGFLVETWHSEKFKDNGIVTRFLQTNHSRSLTGVLRGLHFQLPNPQAKLVSVARGTIYDVAVDVRPTSKTFRQWFGIELSGVNPAMLYVPEGFAHGFYTVDGPADLIYQCSTPYDPDSDRAIAWNDPDIAINWPLTGVEPTLSARDAAAPTSAEMFANG